MPQMSASSSAAAASFSTNDKLADVFQRLGPQRLMHTTFLSSELNHALIVPPSQMLPNLSALCAQMKGDAAQPQLHGLHAVAGVVQVPDTRAYHIAVSTGGGQKTADLCRFIHANPTLPLGALLISPEYNSALDETTDNAALYAAHIAGALCKTLSVPASAVIETTQRPAQGSGLPALLAVPKLISHTGTFRLDPKDSTRAHFVSTDSFVHVDHISGFCVAPSDYGRDYHAAPSSNPLFSDGKHVHVGERITQSYVLASGKDIRAEKRLAVFSQVRGGSSKNETMLAPVAMILGGRK